MYGAPPVSGSLAQATSALESQARGDAPLGAYFNDLVRHTTNETHVELMGLASKGLFLPSWLPVDGTH